MNDDVKYSCMKCTDVVELPKGGYNQIPGYCEKCHRQTIFVKHNLDDATIENYKDNGRFKPKRLADDILRQHQLVTFFDTREIYRYKH